MGENEEERYSVSIMYSRAQQVQEQSRTFVVHGVLRPRRRVRNLIGAGVPERVAMDILRDKHWSVLDRYNIVKDEDLKKAALKHDH